VQGGKNGQGPNLWGIIGRESGQVQIPPSRRIQARVRSSKIDIVILLLLARICTMRSRERRGLRAERYCCARSQDPFPC
jgi:hypothetical protein